MTTDQGSDRTWEALTEVFRTMFGDDTIVLTPETTAKDVDGWDSLAHVQLIVMIEERFGVHFNTGETAAVGNVGQLVERIESKMRP